MTSIPPGTLNHPPQAAGKLPEIGSGFGKSIRNFERATEEKDEVEIKAWSG